MPAARGAPWRRRVILLSRSWGTHALLGLLEAITPDGLGKRIMPQ